MNVTFTTGNTDFYNIQNSVTNKPMTYHMQAADAKVALAEKNYAEKIAIVERSYAEKAKNPSETEKTPAEFGKPSRHEVYNLKASVNRAEHMPEQPVKANEAKTVSEASKSVSSELSQSASKAYAAYKPAHEQLSVSASQTQTAEVASINSAAEEGAKVRLSVAQTAEKQENSGRAFAKNGEDFNTGANKLSIETKEGSFNININVAEGEKNASVLNKTADTINRRDIGVTASVQTNGGTMQLNIAANNTGTSNAFSIEQTPFSNRLGVNETSVDAKDALYTVDNGKEQVSSSNEVYIGKGITALIKEEGNASFEISNREQSPDKVKQPDTFADNGWKRNSGVFDITV